MFAKYYSNNVYLFCLFILLCVIIVERGGTDFKCSGNYYQKYFLIIVTYVRAIYFI